MLKHEIGDDTPFFGDFPINALFQWDPPNAWGVDITKHDTTMEGGAWGYDPPLKTKVDFDRLRLPRVRFDEATTARAMARAHELLGDLLPVTLSCVPPITATLGWYAADLRGLSQMMLDMVDAPELLHRLMAHLRDGALQVMRDTAATGRLTANNRSAMYCSDLIDSQTPEEEHVYATQWCIADSQEFDQVSPAMWEEFCLAYQRPILEQYGLVAYGCGENLTHKIDGVLSISNLRIFVCSAWTDLNRVIERVADRYVIMWRQKASDVVFAEEETELARTLADGVRQLHGCRYQIVLRELQTLAGHPDRLHVWTRLAKQAAERESA
jgi:hypothetical protein